jgi:hypothetical protein
MAAGQSGYRYRSCRDDSWLCDRLLELAREKLRFGYRRLRAVAARGGDSQARAAGLPGIGSGCEAHAGQEAGGSDVVSVRAYGAQPRMSHQLRQRRDGRQTAV